MKNCNTNSTAPVSMCGVPPIPAGSNATTLMLGFGLSQAGAEVIVDVCGMMECLHDRSPAGEAYVMMCDSAGLFKMSMTRLKALLAPEPVEPTPQSVYTLSSGDSSVILKKDGVAVSTVSLCNLTSGCSTPSANTYTLTVSGNNIVLNKDGVPVSQTSICSAVSTCSGNNSGGSGGSGSNGGGGGSSGGGGSGSGGSNTNRAPVATNATYSTLKNISRTTPNLVTLASDPDGDALTVVSVSNPANGTVVNSGGVVTYTPAPEFVGTDSFTYTVSDGSLTATGTITINVDNPISTGSGGSNLI